MSTISNAPQILRYQENEQLFLDTEKREALRQAINSLSSSLRPRLRQFEEQGEYCIIRNLIGTIAFRDGRVVEVVPKTRPGGDWIRAVLSLLVESRVDISGERTGGMSAPREDLAVALARLYTDRIERALRRDGPLLLMQRTHRSSTTFAGKLDVTSWLRDAWKKPVPFPVETSQLQADNDFSCAMAITAEILARVSKDHGIASRLRAAARLLRPGAPAAVALPAGVEHRILPSQWAVYRPAWAIAVAVLGRRSPFSAEGSHRGVTIAIEPWPLLEELLRRSLKAAAFEAAKDGRVVVPKPEEAVPLLRDASGIPTANVKPDGQLIEAGRTLATFDAKYRDRSGDSRPTEGELYQALAEARATGAPLAVLAYPDSRPPEESNIQISGGRPERLLTIGLDLFAYRSGYESAHGRAIWELVR